MGGPALQTLIETSAMWLMLGLLALLIFLAHRAYKAVSEGSWRSWLNNKTSTFFGRLQLLVTVLALCFSIVSSRYYLMVPDLADAHWCFNEPERPGKRAAELSDDENPLTPDRNTAASTDAGEPTAETLVDESILTPEELAAARQEADRLRGKQSRHTTRRLWATVQDAPDDAAYDQRKGVEMRDGESILTPEELEAARQEVRELRGKVTRNEIKRQFATVWDEPDDAAYDQRKAKELGISPAAVAGDRARYRTQDTLAKMEAMNETAPRLRSWMDRADNSAVGLHRVRWKRYRDAKKACPRVISQTAKFLTYILLVPLLVYLSLFVLKWLFLGTIKESDGEK